MAKEDHTLVWKAKLRELVNSILHDDNFTVRAADDAITALSVLRDLKCSSVFSQQFENLPVPKQYRCPISGNLMADPVLLANEQTFDRPFIQNWLNEVQRSYPQTRQVLSHSILMPNYLARDMISLWCKKRGVDLPRPIGGEVDYGEVTEAHKYRLCSLLQKLSSTSPYHKIEAAREFRQLTKRMPSFRTLFRDPEVIRQLVDPLIPGDSTDLELREDLVTTVLNLSIDENNKKALGENKMVITILTESLKTGTEQTRSNAAAAICSLSSIDSNKNVIGKSGAIKYLVALLEKGHPYAMKDAASAIFNLCLTLADDNKLRTVREGTVQVILGKIRDRVLVDELLALLALLSSHIKAVEALGSHGAVPFLLELLRENISERSKENCVAILYTIFFKDITKMSLFHDDEIANGTLSNLEKCGTSRAKRKACGILDRLNLERLNFDNWDIV